MHYALRFVGDVSPDLKSRILGKDLQHKFALNVMGFESPGKTDYILLKREIAPKTFEDQELRDYLDSTLGGNYRLLNIAKALDKMVS
ncbi:hypothetical protein HYT26_03140 [Candidatus Pacearchaeota archaeon]|nr:hypothetical protein [Candidatus Pacearchaeota archaeon]